MTIYNAAHIRDVGVAASLHNDLQLNTICKTVRRPLSLLVHDDVFLFVHTIALSSTSKYDAAASTRRLLLIYLLFCSAFPLSYKLICQVVGKLH